MPLGGAGQSTRGHAAKLNARLLADIATFGLAGGAQGVLPWLARNRKARAGLGVPARSIALDEVGRASRSISRSTGEPRRRFRQDADPA